MDAVPLRPATPNYTLRVSCRFLVKQLPQFLREQANIHLKAVADFKVQLIISRLQERPVRIKYDA